MPKNLIFTDKEAAFLRELVKQKVPFMIVGLSAAALQGAPVVTQGVDLWFKEPGNPKILKALKKVGGSYLPSFQLNPPMFMGKNVELFDIVMNMEGLEDFSKEIKNSIQIPLGKFKVKVLSLERIIKSKEAARRPKDALSLPVLKDTLRTLSEIKKI